MWGQAQNMLVRPEKAFERGTLLFPSLHCKALSFKGRLWFPLLISYPTSRHPSRIEEMPILSLMKETSRNRTTDSGRQRGCGGRCQTSVVGPSFGDCQAPWSQARQCKRPIFKILFEFRPQRKQPRFQGPFHS